MKKLALQNLLDAIHERDYDLLEKSISDLRPNTSYFKYELTSAFHIACKNADINAIRLLLESKNCDLTTANILGETPLDMAMKSECSHIDKVKIFNLLNLYGNIKTKEEILKYAKENAKFIEELWNLAIKYKYPELIELFTNQHTNHIDDNNLSVLQRAIISESTRNDVDFIKMLLNNGANLSYCNRSSNEYISSHNALILALKLQADKDIVILIYEHAKVSDVYDNTTINAIYYACSYNSELLDILLNNLSKLKDLFKLENDSWTLNAEIMNERISTLKITDNQRIISHNQHLLIHSSLGELPTPSCTFNTNIFTEVQDTKEYLGNLSLMNYAITIGKKKSVLVLAKNGADLISSYPSKNYNPIIYSIITTQLDITDSLLEHASIHQPSINLNNITDSKGNTVLHLLLRVVSSKSGDRIELFKKAIQTYKLDPAISNNIGNTVYDLKELYERRYKQASPTLVITLPAKKLPLIKPKNCGKRARDKNNNQTHEELSSPTKKAKVDSITISSHNTNALSLSI
jgi:hypothetical protein